MQSLSAHNLMMNQGTISFSCECYSSNPNSVDVVALATHANGLGSIPVAGGQKDRLISLLPNIRGCAPRGSHTT